MMIDKRIFKITDFEWEMTQKYSFEKLDKVTMKVGGNSGLEKGRAVWVKKLDPKELVVKLDVFNYVRNYGFVSTLNRVGF